MTTCSYFNGLILQLFGLLVLLHCMRPASCENEFVRVKVGPKAKLPLNESIGVCVGDFTDKVQKLMDSSKPPKKNTGKGKNSTNNITQEPVTKSSEDQKRPKRPKRTVEFDAGILEPQQQNILFDTVKRKLDQHQNNVRKKRPVYYELSKSEMCDCVANRMGFYDIEREKVFEQCCYQQYDQAAKNSAVGQLSLKCWDTIVQNCDDSPIQNFSMIVGVNCDYKIYPEPAIGRVPENTLLAYQLQEQSILIWFLLLFMVVG
ncbi:uncharacterized protein LOC142351542 isoform X2 [Convolutriloba macropyga]